VETKVNNTTWKISTTSDDANKANKELRQDELDQGELTKRWVRSLVVVALAANLLSYI
jgi:hypothetical protein